jgi:hypothetical protein
MLMLLPMAPMGVDHGNVATPERLAPDVTKSECIRFVHSCCSLGLYFGSDALNNSGDLWLLVYP